MGSSSNCPFVQGLCIAIICSIGFFFFGWTNLSFLLQVEVREVSEMYFIYAATSYASTITLDSLRPTDYIVRVSAGNSFGYFESVLLDSRTGPGQVSLAFSVPGTLSAMVSVEGKDPSGFCPYAPATLVCNFHSRFFRF
jgi:hypothetical protein